MAAELHAETMHNSSDVKKAGSGTCISCCAIKELNKINFLEDGQGMTAFCADCMVDAILPGKDYHPDVIKAMNRIYFNPCS